jgi:hypothetical protein
MSVWTNVDFPFAPPPCDRDLVLQDLADQADAGQALQESLDILIAARDAVEERAVHRTVAVGQVRRGGHPRVQLAAVVGKQLAGAQVDDAARCVEPPRLGVEVLGPDLDARVGLRDLDHGLQGLELAAAAPVRVERLLPVALLLGVRLLLDVLDGVARAPHELAAVVVAPIGCRSTSASRCRARR